MPEHDDSPPGAGGSRQRRIRGYAEVTGTTRSDILEQVERQRHRIFARLASIRAVVVVVSGKGGVGKSAITANLAVALARAGARVGVLDADLNGPSQGHMLGVLGRPLGAEITEIEGMRPAEGAAGVRVASTELLLEEGEPLRWRGPAQDRFIWVGVTETALLRELLSDVAWGELDYLVVDLPPGTDKIARLLDLVPTPSQVLVVTVPSRVAHAVILRSVAHIREARLPCAALIGNMAGYVGGEGEATTPLFSGPAAEDLARSSGLELWADVPFDPVFGAATDRGTPPGGEGGSPAARAIDELAQRVELAHGGRRCRV